MQECRTVEFGFWDFDPGKKKKFEEMIYDAKKKKFEEMIYDAP